MLACMHGVCVCCMGCACACMHACMLLPPGPKPAQQEHRHLQHQCRRVSGASTHKHARARAPAADRRAVSAHGVAAQGGGRGPRAQAPSGDLPRGWHPRLRAGGLGGAAVVHKRELWRLLHQLAGARGREGCCNHCCCATVLQLAALHEQPRASHVVQQFALMLVPSTHTMHTHTPLKQHKHHTRPA